MYAIRSYYAEQALGVGVVLTIPAAGSESSTSSVLSDDETQTKRGCSSELLRPRFAFMNPELTFTLPAYQTAAGAADIMAHIMERYFTNARNVALTDRLCEAALRTVIDNLPRVLAAPDDYDARAEIMWAGSIAHNDLLGTGREGDWASHGIEHELSALYDVAHGAGLAVVFPAWMKFAWKHDVSRFARFATEVWGVERDWLDPERVALEGIRRLEAFFSASGLPVRLTELGIPLDRLDEMAARAVMKGNGFLGKFVELDAQEVRIIVITSYSIHYTKLYEAAFRDKGFHEHRRGGGTDPDVLYEARSARSPQFAGNQGFHRSRLAPALAEHHGPVECDVRVVRLLGENPVYPVAFQVYAEDPDIVVGFRPPDQAKEGKAGIARNVVRAPGPEQFPVQSHRPPVPVGAPDGLSYNFV